MNLGYFSYLLASLTLINTILWYVYTNRPGLVLSLSIASYLIWTALFFRSATNRLNLADRITMTRWTIVILSVLLILALGRTTWIVTATISIALILDAVDGWMARKYQISSQYGRVIDMEVDHMTTSLLVAVSVMIVGIDAWFLVLNLLRPAYLLFGKQKLNEVEYRKPAQLIRAKVIFALSQILLIINLAPILSIEVKSQLSLLNLILLTYSFGVDLILERRHHKEALSTLSK